MGFANCTTDHNPIHIDKKYAHDSIFKKRIAHGMLIGGFISSVLGNDFPGVGTIYVSQTLNFKKPVFLGDVITVTIVIKEFTERNWLTLSTVCQNQDVQIVVNGTAVVVPPKGARLIKD